MRQFKTTIVVFAAVSLMAACGSNGSGSEDAGGDDTGQSEDVTEMDTGMEDTAPAPDTEDGEEDTATADTSMETCLENEDSDKIPLNSFKYYEQDQGGHSTQSGVGVSLSGDLQITKIDPGNPDCKLDCADAKTLRNDLIDQEVRQKMKDDTWKCGSEDDQDGVQHKFEAQLGTTFDDPGNVLTTVTGCIPDDSTAEDAELARDVADTLMELRKTYFEDRGCHSS